jgi:cytochrome P450
VAELVELLEAGGEPADLIARVAEPLPVEVIAELLGVPASDRPLLRPWSNAIVKMYEYRLAPALQADAEASALAFVGYLRELVAQRRRAPLENDMITDLVAAADGADRLSQDEIVGTCVLLLMAGHETTMNVIGNGMLAMLHHPRQWQRVVQDAALIAPATAEMIRFDSSLQLFERTATRDVRIEGVTVPEGGRIAALLGAAHRDPAVFDDPDTFDIGRVSNPHLGFGAGIHFCLGAPLARIEVQAVLASLRRRLPGIALAAEPRRRSEFVIRGLEQLLITA